MKPTENSGVKYLAALTGVTVMLLAYIALAPRVTTRTARSPLQLLHDQSDRDALQSIQKDTELGNFASAEAAAIRYAATHPDDSFAQRGLGDVYYAMGNGQKAREAYERIFRNPSNWDNNPEIPTRYGELCYQEGLLSKAKDAYLHVLKDQELSNYVPIPARSGDANSLSQLRGMALSIDAVSMTGQIGRYLSTTASAIQAAPSSPFVCCVRADALYRAGRIAESHRIFEKALALADSTDRSLIKHQMDRFYDYKNWDHTSIGVIGKDGKVSITYKKTPLPENLPNMNSRFTVDSKKPGPVVP